MKLKKVFKINKPVYLDLSVLDIRKIAIYDYVKPKYGKTAKLCYVDTHSIIVYVKSENIFADLAGDVKKMSDTLNYEIKRPLPTEKKDQIYER